MPHRLEIDQIKRVIEAALLATEAPLTIERLVKLFTRGELEAEQESQHIRDALKAIETDAQDHGYELKRVASGYRFQVRQELSPWVSRLWDERPPRYSRATLGAASGRATTRASGLRYRGETPPANAVDSAGLAQDRACGGRQAQSARIATGSPSRARRPPPPTALCRGQSYRRPHQSNRRHDCWAA